MPQEAVGGFWQEVGAVHKDVHSSEQPKPEPTSGMHVAGFSLHCTDVAQSGAKNCTQISVGEQAEH